LNAAVTLIADDVLVQVEFWRAAHPGLRIDAVCTLGEPG
jgi:hypothetical protein